MSTKKKIIMFAILKGYMSLAMHASCCCYNTIAMMKQLLNVLYRGMKSDWLDTEISSYITESDPSVAMIRLFVTLRDRTDR